jgi:hypothetical protein
VQRDHGLAGARAPGDRDDALAGRPDREVLLGLDGGHDGVHRAVAGAGQLGHQGALADDRQPVGGGVVGVEEVVLHGGHPGPGATQHASSYDALGVRRGRLVEHGRGRRAPVDQHRVAVLVTQADPADVARPVALGDGVVEVEPPEHQTLVGGVEGRDPLRRLEHHRVALDETALVSEAAAAVALLGERLGVLGRQLELPVDAVDELLLGGDLLLGYVVACDIDGQVVHRSWVLRVCESGKSVILPP